MSVKLTVPVGTGPGADGVTVAVNVTEVLDAALGAEEVSAVLVATALAGGEMVSVSGAEALLE